MLRVVRTWSKDVLKRDFLDFRLNHRIGMRTDQIQVRVHQDYAYYPVKARRQG